MLELLREHVCFGGIQRFYRHASREIGLPTRCSVFVPEMAATTPVPALFYLTGLTCTEETFMIKAGAQRVAVALGMALITADTSSRGANVVGETDAWDFGFGAGFYVDAIESPWNAHYRMCSYMQELRELVINELPINASQTGIVGHSLGGHGALILALRNPQLFKSVSAIAPIAAPTQCPWGKEAFAGYLCADQASWQQYDASALMASMRTLFPSGILLDQGLSDQFLFVRLLPELFEEACQKAAQPLMIRRHIGYDHAHYFISTVVEDHIRFHRRAFDRASG